MPSPLAHLTAGYLCYLTARGNAPAAEKVVGIAPLLVVTVVFSVLPDLDSVAGLLLGNFGAYHNNATHSLLVGVAVSLAFAAFLAWRGRGFTFWFLMAVIPYSLHVVMDATTVGRGVMAFWPLTDRRFLFPVPLFYGFHWSDGWVSISHLWTLLTELGFTVLALVAWRAWSRRRQQGG